LQRHRGSSPHTWGCFCIDWPSWEKLWVFPTHVGVFQYPKLAKAKFGGLPHTRGGVSIRCKYSAAAAESSPHTWGCFPGAPTGGDRRSSLPHTRGGVSMAFGIMSVSAMSSPHTWGCFSGICGCCSTARVFPTHVGVFPSSTASSRTRPCLPHTRGGVSRIKVEHFDPFPSSPHTWGCFCGQMMSSAGSSVFPTHVGVFLYEIDSVDKLFGLPHTRGGVSI